MKPRIDIGDIVSVDFNGSQFTLTARAKVLFTPSGPGDSWGFEDCLTQKIYYVSEGCTITKEPTEGE